MLGPALSGAACGQSAPGPAEASSIEGHVRQMLQVINEGSPRALRDFASTHFAERFLQDTPVDKVVDHFQEMKSESGGIDVALVLKPEMAGQANLLLRTRTGHHFVRIVAFEDGGRITDFFLLTATNPQGDISNDWPKEKIPQADIHTEIERHATFAASRDLFSGVVLVANGGRSCSTRRTEAGKGRSSLRIARTRDSTWPQWARCSLGSPLGNWWRPANFLSKTSF